MNTSTSAPEQHKTTTTTASAAPSTLTESRIRSLDERTRMAIKIRKLTSGNNIIETHGLGSPVQKLQPPNQKQ